ncbi:ExbD/TolR family protein [Cochlodiniinecator piscidefendens]|uniref:ExbD/TolR family protein n=1 Tax=Cochlodiniinecator piscidefendens TaxID=2715756 RepID=UPI00140ADEF8|nr:biopolymer transporter ExbD [Cochlodiniinecator piscidefendens]
MTRRRPEPRKPAEPTITLINVVFLMLVFFLIAGTVAPPLDGELKLISTDQLEGRQPPDAIVLHADGRLTFQGSVIDPAVYPIEANTALRIIPDRQSTAAALLEASSVFRSRGASEIYVVTERGLR